MNKGIRRFKRPLECILTEDERRDVAWSVAKMEAELAEEERLLKAESTERREAIKELRKRIRDGAIAVTEGKERRPVDCEERPSDRSPTVEIIRLDTGEIIETRPQTPEERQLGMAS